MNIFVLLNKIFYFYFLWSNQKQDLWRQKPQTLKIISFFFFLMSLSLNRLLNSRSGFPWKRLFGHFFSSTAAHTRSFSLYRRMSPLYRRISPLGDSKISMVPVLDEWVQKGGTVNEEELRDIIQKLNHYRRFKHALEVSIYI